MEYVFPCQDILNQMVYIVVIVTQLILFLPVLAYTCNYETQSSKKAVIYFTLAAIFHIRINNGKFCATIFIETRKNEIK